MIGPCLAVLSARFRMLLQYRAAALAGVGTQLFWGLIRVMIFEAFYRSGSGAQPMSYDEVVTYVWLGQALFALIPFRGDTDIRDMIRSGTVAYEIVRPVDLYAYWFSRALAGRLAPTLLRSTPLLIVALLFLGAAPPPSLASFAIWLAATAGAFLLSAAITTLFSIVMLWTISGEGVNQVMPTLVFIGSGMIIPLPLFPDWIQPALNVLPFRHLIDTPFRLYIGHIPPREGLMILLEQLLWLAVLIVGSRWLLGRGVRRLIVHGG